MNIYHVKRVPNVCSGSEVEEVFYELKNDFIRKMSNCVRNRIEGKVRSLQSPSLRGRIGKSVSSLILAGGGASLGLGAFPISMALFLVGTIGLLSSYAAHTSSSWFSNRPQIEKLENEFRKEGFSEKEFQKFLDQFKLPQSEADLYFECLQAFIHLKRFERSLAHDENIELDSCVRNEFFRNVICTFNEQLRAI